MDTNVNNVNVTDLLKRIDIFSELDEAALSDLAKQCQRRHFRRDVTIFHEGDPGHLLHIICAGCVNVQNETSDGDVVHLARRGPGQCFGEMALIDGKPRMADVIAIEPTETLTLHRDVFINAVLQRPEIALKVMAVLADRLREAAERMRALRLEALGRVADALLNRLDADAAPEPGGGKRLKARVTQNELADEVGATRETVNRSLRNLKDTGIIRMEGRALIVLDEKRLRRLGSH